MKKLMVAVMAAAAFSAFAEEAQELEKQEAPLFWGFGNTGIYSGYQLYGSLVNSEPTWQTYLEGNMNLLFKDVDLGYLGVGIWSNSDLTDRRRTCNLGRMWNEWDFNVHWGKTFWLDDNHEWGLDYRTSVVWYYYPGLNYHGGNKPNNTTMDWNHSFSLLNPYVIPFIDVVHEYHESDGNLLQAGLKRVCQVNDQFSLMPSATVVWRNSHYNWCFPTGFGFAPCNHGSGLATLKLGLDANYQISDNFGIFAKVAYCSIVDPDLRDNCDDFLGGNAYGDKKDFAWGGVGVTFNF